MRAKGSSSLRLAGSVLPLLLWACGSSSTGDSRTSSGASTASNTGGADTTGGNGASGTSGAGTNTAGATGAASGGDTVGAVGSGSGGTNGPATGGGSSTTGFDYSNTGNVTGGFVYDAGAPVEAAVCQQFDLGFKPQIPTVILMVDRSGSATQKQPDGGPSIWTQLKSGALPVIQTLQDQVWFGFAAFEGTNGGTCPILDTVPAANHNYDMIAAKYNALVEDSQNQDPRNMGKKPETPASKVFPLLGNMLLNAADAGPPGAKYILFVTDGEPDFCDDGDAVCPVDAVVGAIQTLYAKRVSTLILGLPTATSTLASSALQAWANAGAGQPVAVPPINNTTGTITDIYNHCSHSQPMGWPAEATAAGIGMNQALGTYAATGGNATVYTPSSISQSALTDAISAALKTVKSCSFDLSNQSVEVDLAHANRGTVTLDGTNVPFDAANGWQMTTSTTLTLVGSACTAWKANGMTISGSFPCDVIKTRI